jgi:hypothetical protein
MGGTISTIRTARNASVPKKPMKLPVGLLRTVFTDSLSIKLKMLPYTMIDLFLLMFIKLFETIIKN